jgi:uncharacterized protein
MFDSAQMEAWEKRFEALLRGIDEADSSHGLDHIKRVVASAKHVAVAEDARLEIVVPAAWLHDCVTVEKDSPDRAKASTLAAERAREYLEELGYPEELLGEIYHCVQAHSFSACVMPESLEAKVVQDADRLDALGAIGVARSFTVGGRLGLPICADIDPFCRDRPPDDSQATLDHFFAKLLTLPETMQTAAGRLEAERRVSFLRSFLEQLESELPSSQS